MGRTIHILNIEHDLAIANELTGYPGLRPDHDVDVGSKPLIDAPLENGANEVWFGGNHETPSGGAPLPAHHFFGGRQGIDEALAGEYPLGVLHQWRSRLRQLDAVVVKPPKQGGKRDIEHGKILAKHVLLLDEHRRKFRQTITHVRPRLVRRLEVLLESLDVAEQFVLHGEQQLARARARLWIRRHQLRMRETLVDVLVDDVGLVKHEVAINQYRHPVVRIDDGDVLRLVEQIDIYHLKIHLLFVQDDPAAMAERAGGARVQVHHGTRTPRIVGITNHLANQWCADFSMPHM